MRSLHSYCVITINFKWVITAQEPQMRILKFTSFYLQVFMQKWGFQPATTLLSSQSRRSQSADILTVDSRGSYFVETGWHNAIWKEIGIIKLTTVSAPLEFWKTWMDIIDAGLKIAEVRCNFFLLACLKKALCTPDVKIFWDRNAVSPQISFCLHADYLKTSRDNDFKQNVITPEKAQLKWFLHLQHGSLRSSDTCWLGLMGF